MEIVLAHQFERSEALARLGDLERKRVAASVLRTIERMVAESSTTKARLGTRTRTERSTSVCTASARDGLPASPSVPNTLPAVVGEPSRMENGGLPAAGIVEMTCAISASGKSPSR